MARQGSAVFMSAHIIDVTLTLLNIVINLISPGPASPLYTPKPQPFIEISNETQMVPERTIFTFRI